MNMQAVGGLLGLLAGGAAAFSPDEAQAAPRPQYMEELVAKLKSRDFETGMNFGEYSARDLKKKGLEAKGFTPGPVKLSPKNIAKFNNERIQQNHMTPEQFVDGLNSAIHGTRGRDFPNKKDLRMRLVPETEWHEKKPVVQHFWKGVVAPHDGFTGLVTGYKYKIKDAQKDLKRFSGERPSSPYPDIPEGAGTQQGELSAVGEPSQVIDNAMVHDSSTLRKGLLPLFAGGAGAAAMTPGEAQAAIPADQYRFPADEPGWVNPEPPLEDPLVSPVDWVLAPAGVAKASGKVAAVAAEPFVAWGMDTAAGWLGETAAPALWQAAGGFVEAAAPRIAQSWGWMSNAAGGLLEYFQQEDD